MLLQIKKHTYFLLAILLLSFNFYSQSPERVEASKFFAKSYFRLPIVTSNDFFKEASRGISDVALSLNYKVYKGFNLGVGFKHSFFEISQFKITEKLDAQTHIYGPYAEASYIAYLSSNVFVDMSLQAGYFVMSSSSNPIRANGADFNRTQSSYISPNLSFYLVGPERISYCFSLGYTLTQTSMTPQTYGLDSFKDYDKPDYEGNLQHVNFGFGILVNIGKLQLIETP